MSDNDRPRVDSTEGGAMSEQVEQGYGPGSCKYGIQHTHGPCVYCERDQLREKYDELCSLLWCEAWSKLSPLVQRHVEDWEARKEGEADDESIRGCYEGDAPGVER